MDGYATDIDLIIRQVLLWPYILKGLSFDKILRIEKNWPLEIDLIMPKNRCSIAKQ